MSNLKDYYENKNPYGMDNLYTTNIIGLPFQFNGNGDTRHNGIENTIGRMYGERIMSNMPICIMRVGRPKFLQARTIKDFGKNWAAAAESESELKSLLEALEMKKDSKDPKSYRYMDFEDTYSSGGTGLAYKKSVENLIRALGVLMGMPQYAKYNLDDTTHKNGSNLERLAWGETINFCMDKSTSYSESSGSELGESMLSSLMGGLSEKGKEIQFLMGNQGLTEYAKSNDIDVTAYGTGKATDVIGSILGSAKTTISTGASMLLPQIWKDSSFNKSIDIKMKFISPYGDKASIMDNVYIPLMHVLALAMPQQLESNPNSYLSPFLVKAFSKGWFNCDLGIIDSISVDRGNPDEWTMDGLPARIDVSITIKDIYQQVAMSISDDAHNLISHNTGMKEYLQVLAGLEINKISVVDTLKAHLELVVGKVVDKFNLRHISTNTVRNVANFAPVSRVSRVISGLF